MHRHILPAMLLVLFSGLSMGQLQAQAPNFDKLVSDRGSYKEKGFKQAPQRVFIQEFRVYFQVLAAAQDRSRGGGFGGTVIGATQTTMGVGLDGVSVEQLHNITNQLYNEYVARLEASGYTLVSADEAAKTAELSDWTRYAGGGEPSAAQVGGYLTMTPAGADFFYRRQTASGKTKGSVLIDNAHRISGQLDDAVVAAVSLVVPFVQLETGTTFNAAAAGSKVKGNVYLVLAAQAIEQEVKTGILAGMQTPDRVATYSRYTSGNGVGAGGDAFVYHAIKKDVPIAGVAEKRKIVARTAAESATATSSSSVNLAGYLMVSADDRASKSSHTVTVNGDTYQKQVFATLDGFVDKSLDEFLSLVK